MGRQPVGCLLNDEATGWMPVNGMAIAHTPQVICMSSGNFFLKMLL